MGKLDGKVALVSGSGRGIGRAIALKLASEGAWVVVNDLDEAPAAETVAAVRAAGTQALAVVGDVVAADFGARFVGAALDRWGRIDIIVNNAGYAWDAVVQKVEDEQWQAMLDVHAAAPFRILRAAAGYIRAAAKAEAEAGRVVSRKVVNVSSIAGLSGNPGQIAYAAGKAAVVGMTRTLAKEWGRYNVCVNCVAFGWIRTRMTEPVGSGGGTAVIAGRSVPMGLPPETIARMEGLIPLGRGGTPEEAAGAVYLLCLPEADYISGEVLVAGGGFRG
ncbi:SDR family NAD(P)-dependent oxidoreductase [Azospirillum sp. ST 5-10]|uniref:SDR family NAD(P)-dependent oxidoreductase n=1 Tax=unclassified Azospirillum TaxID=2630922 RepID=UPI003F49EC9B